MNNALKLLIAVVSSLLFFPGCETTGPQKAPLEIQAFQKKEFEASKKVAFASVVSVLQDLGYIVKTADFTTGLITASSPTKNVVFFGSFMSNTDVTAFIEELNEKKSTIRLNFVQVQESSSGYGMKSKSDKPVLDPQIYQNAFAKIQEAIFVRVNSGANP